ncbi:hypothetical protein JNUCC64_17910 [Streptomyces sp. JNUCC 64]
MNERLPSPPARTPALTPARTPGRAPARRAPARTVRAVRAAAVLALLLPPLAACEFLTGADHTPQRHKDGVSDLQLDVTGQPTPGSLSAVEHVLARLKERDADGLAELSTDGDEKAAREWVRAWGGAAGLPMTADFVQGEPSAWVEVAFEGRESKLSFSLDPASEDEPYADRFEVRLTDDDRNG